MTKEAGNSRRRLLIVAALVIAVTGIVRAPSFVHHFHNVDEGEFALLGEGLLDGERLYVDLFDSKPPLTYAFYAAVFGVAGRDMRLVHAATALWIVLTALLLFGLVECAGWNRAAPWAAVLFALYSGTISLAANSETLMALPLVAGMWAALRGFQERRAGLFFLSGMAIAGAALFRLQGGIGLPLLLAWMSVLAWRRAIPSRAIGRGAVLLVLGFAFPWALFVGLCAVRGSLPDVWFALGTFNWRYAAEVGVRLSWRQIGTIVVFFVVPATAWLWGGAVGGIILRLRRCAGDPFLWLLILWVVGSVVAVAVGGRFYEHYFIQMLPPLACLAAVATAAIIDVLWCRQRLFAILVIAFIAWTPLRTAFSLLQIVRSGRTLEQWTAFRTTVDQVRLLTAPSDRVLFWGHYTPFYYFADRYPPTRFASTTQLMTLTDPCRVPGDADWNALLDPTLWRRFSDELRARPPAIIVDTTNTKLHCWRFPLAAVPSLQSFLREHYWGPQRIGGLDYYFHLPRP